MSRPWFALSVMLSSLATCLLAIDKTYGTDDVVSPSHDPSECVVCPLAHGAEAPCGDFLCSEYSDYDYNDYSEEEAAPAPAIEEVASTADSQPGEEPEVVGYDPYYDDYDWYAEDAASTELADEVATAESIEADAVASVPAIDDIATVDEVNLQADVAEAYEMADEYDGYYDDYDWPVEDATEAEETPSTEESLTAKVDEAIEDDVADSAPVDAATESADVDQDDADYDDHDWYAEEHGEPPTVSPVAEADEDSTRDADRDEVHAMEEDFLSDGDSYESLMKAEVAATAEESIDGDFEYPSGYETYEDMMRGADSEASAQPVEDFDFNGYDSYDEFMEAARAELDDASVDVSSSDEAAAAAADEDTWEADEYGYYDDYEQYIEEYEFEAPATQEAPATDAADVSIETGYDDAYDDAMTEERKSAEPAADVNSDVHDDYESFYDAYDGLYNYEDEDCEYRDVPGPVIAEFEAGQSSADDLASEIVGSVVDEIASTPGHSSYGCEWDCEAEYWNELNTCDAAEETASMILDAAQSIDDMAVTLEGVADFLRDVANGERTLLGKKVDSSMLR